MLLVGFVPGHHRREKGKSGLFVCSVTCQKLESRREAVNWTSLASPVSLVDGERVAVYVLLGFFGLLPQASELPTASCLQAATVNQAKAECRACEHH